MESSEPSFQSIMDKINYPWTSNQEIEYQNYLKWKQFDDEINMTIEYFYQKWKQGDKSY